MMATTSKSPKMVLFVAHEAARRSIPPYAHRFAPKTFTHWQLFACLVLKAHQQQDYRGVWQLLLDSADLRQAIGLAKVPHWTTIQKAATRLLKAPKVQRLLKTTITLLRPQRQVRVKHAAADSTGFDQHHTSRYFIWRRDNQQHKGAKRPQKRTTYRRYGKLMVLVCCCTHVVIAAVASAGPTPDINELDPLMRRLPDNTRVERLVADAGFDSAYNHQLLRERYGILSTIPPTHGRPALSPTTLPTNRYRRLMKQRFNRRAYRHRSQVETVMSMLKRNFGSSLRGRTHHSRCRDMLLMVLTHNIAIPCAG